MSPKTLTISMLFAITMTALTADAESFRMPVRSRTCGAAEEFDRKIAEARVEDQARVAAEARARDADPKLHCNSQSGSDGARACVKEWTQRQQAFVIEAQGHTAERDRLVAEAIAACQRPRPERPVRGSRASSGPSGT